MAIFLDPEQRPSADTELAEYRLHRNDPDDPTYRAWLKPLADALLARLSPGDEGLDFGCGPGPALAAMLREAGHPVRLFDPLFAPDAAALRQRYRFVACSETAEHFHRPAEEFALFDRLLAPGGWLALMTGFPESDEAFASWHYRRDPTHVVFYREQTLRWLAQRYGWSCEIPARNLALMQKPATAG